MMVIFDPRSRELERLYCMAILIFMVVGIPMMLLKVDSDVNTQLHYITQKEQFEVGDYLLEKKYAAKLDLETRGKGDSRETHTKRARKHHQN